ncbi:MAG: AraC family transcriptional regulator [Candidatus Melainabacteria bacterium]|nr:AraC family transcriptional regulator [Candidatus Melainabacteria bacterium]
MKETVKVPDNILPVAKAINFIEERLEQPLDVKQVSGHIGFSEYYFHRMFQSVLGESVAEYVRKRRLSEAARKMLARDEKLIEIALSCGYDSQEAFTRAFKSMFGMTPGRLRKLGMMPLEKKPATIDMMLHLEEGLTMQPEIVEHDEELVIGMGSSFAENPFWQINKLWDKFSKRENEIPNLSGNYALGVCMPKHQDIPVKEGDTFVYIAGRPVSTLDEVPEGMVAVKIPRRKYAKFTHKGALTNLPHTVNYIWGTWLPKSEYKHSNSPDFELYDERFDVKSLSGEIDIFVPID